MMPPSSPILSVCMIVKNEAHQLSGALENFSSFADEIIVVDTGSTDETRAIAESYTPHVYDFPWSDDFSIARNESLARAHGDYILWMDADDRVDDENCEKIRLLKTHFDGRKAFYFILQGMDKTGPSESLYQLRCVPRLEGIRFRFRIHEELHTSVWSLGLKTFNVDITIFHHGYQDRELFLKKIRRNLSILEKERSEGRSDAQIHFYLALSYDHLNRGRQSIEAMKEALLHLEKEVRDRPISGSRSFEPSPFLMEAHLFLAQAFSKVGERDQATRHLIKANALCDENAQSHYRLACLYQEMNRHRQAIGCLAKALEGKTSVSFIPLPPVLPRRDILVQMAFSLLCLKERTLAMRYLEEAWDLGVGIADSWERIGLTALKAREDRLALQAYEASLSTGELSPDGYCNLGLIYKRQGLWQKANGCYEKALQKEPKLLSALANLGHLCLEIGETKRAKRAFSALIEEGAREVDILLALGLISARERDVEGITMVERMILEDSSMAGVDCTGRDGSFFERMARGLESQNRRKLAAWAVEIAGFAKGLEVGSR